MRLKNNNQIKDNYPKKILKWMILHIQFLLITEIFSNGIIEGQNVKWAITGGGSSEKYLNDFHFDHDRLLIVGNCDANFDAIFGTRIIPGSPSSIASVSCFVASCDTLNQWMWAFGGGGSYITNSIAVTTDEHHNVYHTGFTGRELFYDNMLFPATDYNYAPVFLIKHDKQGNFKWLRRFGQDYSLNTLSDGAGTGLVYHDGYVYVLGEISSGGVFYNTVLNAPNIYLAKFNTSGTFIWAKYLAKNIPGGYLSGRITVDNRNHLLITGLFNYKIAIGNDTLNTDNFKYNSFLCETDTSGNLLFTRKITDTKTYAEILGICFDDESNIYVTGTFRDSLTVDSTVFMLDKDDTNDGFILKFDEHGGVLWGKHIEGYGDQISCDLVVHNNALFCTGNFSGEIIIENISGYSTASEDIFLLKLDKETGDFFTGYIFGTETSNENVVGIETDDNRNIYLAGYFNNKTEFGNKKLYTSVPEETDVFLFCFDEYGIPSGILSNRIAGNTLKVYPNPASDFITIASQENILPVKMDVMDINGHIIYSRMLFNSTELIYRSDLGIEKNGIYIFRLFGRGFQKIEKIVWQ
jgi:hypothetical protein